MNKVLLSYFTMTTALTSLGLQLILSSKVLELTGKGIKSQSMALAFFLSGLSIGAYLFNKYKERARGRDFLILYITELCVSLVAIVALPLISIAMSSLFLFGHIQLVAPVQVPLLFTYSVTLPFALFLGFFSGIQLPVILNLYQEDENKLLFLNYFGSLFAGPIINVFLNNSLALEYHIGFFLFFNSLNLLIISLSKKWKKGVVFSLVPILGAYLVISIYPKLEHIEKSSYYFGHKINSLKQLPATLNIIEKYGEIETIRTPYQNIDLVTEPPMRESYFNGNFSLYLNRKPQFNLLTQEIYHESMFYGSVNLHRSFPKEILVLGAGDGLLLDNILNHDELTSVTLVELDQRVIAISKENQTLRKMNNHVFDRNHEKLDLIVDDAINFLRRTTKKYDAIFIDFPFPYDQELLKLYSKEFYTMVKRKLNPNSYIVMDFPMFGESSPYYKVSRSIIASLKAAEFGNVFIYGPNTPFLYADNKEENPALDFSYDQIPKYIHLGTFKNLFSINHQFDLSIKTRPISLFLTDLL